MSYSVNFSENAGKIVLDNVVMNGAKYAPSAVTEVFTKDATGNLKKEVVDLKTITYTSTGTAGAGATTTVAPGATGATTTVAPGAPGTPGAGATTTVAPGATGATTTGAIVVAPTAAEEEALQKAQIAISIAISSARTYKDAKFTPLPTRGGSSVPTAVEAIAKVGTAIVAVGDANKLVEVVIETKYKEKKIQLDAINTALTELKTVLNNFNTASPEPTEDELETAIKQVKTTHNKLFTSNRITGGAPLRFGSSSSKTKRNRRRNRRFAKKSYKRRH
jgi:hypothetical protein